MDETPHLKDEGVFSAQFMTLIKAAKANTIRIASVFLTVAILTGYVFSALSGTSWIYSAVIIVCFMGLVFLAQRENKGRYPSHYVHASEENSAAIAVITIITYFSGKYISLLSHEWAHAIWANILKVRTGSIFDIHYGSNWTLSHIWAVDDGKFYQELFEEGNNTVAGLVAMGGVLTNILIILFSIALLLKFDFKRYIFVYFLFFWTLIHNLGQVVSYIPLRTVFYDGGDIYLFSKALNIPQWLILIVGTSMLYWGFFVVFKKIIPQMLYLTKMPFYEQFYLIVLSWCTLFLWYGSLPVILSVSTFFNVRMSLVVLNIFVGTVLIFLTKTQYVHPFETHQP